MIFDQVPLVSRHIQPIPVSAVEQLEGVLETQLPKGYKTFITRWGLGIYCDLFRIYSPDRILQEYVKYRESWKNLWYFDAKGERHWYFEGNEKILNEAQLQQSIIIGDSIDGDKLIFFPFQPDKIYILPRHSRTITWVKADLSDLHQWNTTAPRLLTFAPWHDQITLYFLSEQYSLDRAGCLDQFKKRWGADAVLLSYENSDQWSWALVFYVPPIGGRVQVTQDEEVTRTYVDQNGSIITVQGNGQRSLAVRFDCDQEAATEVRLFISHLEAERLCTWKQ